VIEKVGAVDAREIMSGRLGRKVDWMEEI